MQITSLSDSKLVAVDRCFLIGPDGNECRSLGEYTVYVEAEFQDEDGTRLYRPEITGYVLPPSAGTPHPLIRELRGVSRVSTDFICSVPGGPSRLQYAGISFARGFHERAMEQIIRTVRTWTLTEQVTDEFVEFLKERPCTNCAWPCELGAATFGNETDVFAYEASIVYNEHPYDEDTAIKVTVSRLTCTNPEALLQDDIEWKDMELEMNYDGYSHVVSFTDDSPPHPHLSSGDYGGACLSGKSKRIASRFIRNNMHKDAVDCILNTMAVIVTRGMYQEYVFPHYNINMCNECGDIIHEADALKCRGCGRLACPNCYHRYMEVDPEDENPAHEGITGGTYCLACIRRLEQDAQRRREQQLMSVQPERVGRMRRALMLRDVALITERSNNVKEVEEEAKEQEEGTGHSGMDGQQTGAGQEGETLPTREGAEPEAWRA